MTEAHVSEATLSERELGQLFERAVHMIARLLWQEASRRQQRKYPLYEMARIEFRRALRDYELKVKDKEALDLDTAFAVLEEVISLIPVEYEDDITPRIAGENLRSVSAFLCCIGEPACPGDIETFLRDAWDPESSREERRYIRTYEGRRELLIYLNTFLSLSSEEITKLAEQRGVPALRYFRLDANGDFELDREVLDTNYLAAVSFLELAEGASGHA